MGEAEPRFIVDSNVGKLARWLRLMGYDTLLFVGRDDNEMVRIAFSQNRIILTRDTQVMRRRLITSGRIRALFIEHEDILSQVHQVISNLALAPLFKPFTRCLECNTPLLARNRVELEGLVPPHVFATQDRYVECPGCHRIYWKGSHWQAMQKRLDSLARE